MHVSVSLRALVLLAITLSFSVIDSLVHELVIAGDNRNLFDIETFGFLAGGRIDVVVRDFKINRRALDKSPTRAGFILRKAESEYQAKQDLDNAMDLSNSDPLHPQLSCILDNPRPNDIVLDMSGKSEGSISQEVLQHADGLYSFIFARCLPPGKHYTVDFKMHADFHNPGPDYLSAGDSPLPILYFGFFCLFSTAFLFWCWLLHAYSSIRGSSKPRGLHYMMGALLFIKSICLLVESIRYYYIQTGGSSPTWNIAYYVVTTLRGSMLFTVILLIGSGWSLIKAYLSAREKNIIIIVFALQVFDNIAMV